MGTDKNPRPIVEPGKDYSTGEIETGAKWVDGKPIFRKGIDFGALPNAGTKNVAHGLTNPDDIVDVRGVAFIAAEPPKAYPMPNVGIAVSLDTTNIIVTTTADLSTYTDAFFFVEYTKA